MTAADGKRYRTTAANIEGFLRIIQSISSPKAEPLKQWLAQIGREHIEETIDPEQPQTFSENQKVARRGGSVVGIAREALEAETGKPAVTPKNAANFHRLLTDIIEDAAMLPESTESNKKIAEKT